MGFIETLALAQCLLSSLTYASASNLNPHGQGCVDPSGYLQCYQQNENDFTSCMEDAKRYCLGDALTDCELACGNVLLAANIGCWLTSCWNQVYSCAYQETALQYLTGAGLEQGPTPIPYYPAPDNAPGGCVCNLGYIWGNYTVTYAQRNPCSAYDIVSAGVVTEASCQCCWDSSILSDVVELCPNNDLSALAIDIMLDSFEAGYNNSASDQCSILNDGEQCAASFSLDTVASTWYNPGQLPSGYPGTAPLSDTNSGGSITSAPDPYTYSIFPSYISVITPAPYNSKKAAATNTVTDIETGTVTSATQVSPTGTGATGGSTSSSASQQGAASNLIPPLDAWHLAIYIVACAGVSGVALTA